MQKLVRDLALGSFKHITLRTIAVLCYFFEASIRKLYFNLAL
jgi:hypothetical protein